MQCFRLGSSVLNLVDLAGSEKHPHAPFRRSCSSRRVVDNGVLVELTFINQSLSALGHCISALVARQKYIPYRNSKLTTLLKDSLGGRSQCCMIVCVNPSEEFIDETLQTLKFADRARTLRLPVEKVPVNTGREATVAGLMQEVESLKNALTVERSKNENLLNALAPRFTQDHRGDLRGRHKNRKHRRHWHREHTRRARHRSSSASGSSRSFSSDVSRSSRSSSESASGVSSCSGSYLSSSISDRSRISQASSFRLEDRRDVRRQNFFM